MGFINLDLQKSRLGFYFHIPFCPHICPYCDFKKTSHFSRLDVLNYFYQLEIQLLFFIDELKNYSSSKDITVYFGGGTPGLFEAKFYKPIIDILNNKFNIEELTLETNPLTNFKRKIKDYANIGFNRITLGAQSLCQSTLYALGRKHSPDQILSNIKYAKYFGFENIQVDLIYGLDPNIRTISLKNQITELFQTGASGISAYALTIEERTSFAKNPHISNEDAAASDYLEILKTCEDLGFKQVETSNFSRYATKHNNIYWYGYPYIGIGTGAHGLLPPSKNSPYGIRYKVGVDGKEKKPGNDLLDFKTEKSISDNFKIIYEGVRTQKEYLQEMLFTLLRTPEGIPLKWLESEIKSCSIQMILNNHLKLKKALQLGLISCEHNSIRISAQEKIRGDAWAFEIINAILA